MRYLLLGWLLLVPAGWLCAQAPVVQPNQVRTIVATADVGDNVGAPIFATNTPTNWTITMETNPGGLPGGVGINEVFFDITAGGQLLVAQSLFPFFSALRSGQRATETVSLMVMAFNANGASAAETVTVEIVQDAPIILANQTRFITVGIGSNQPVGDPLITLNGPTYFYIASGNTNNAFSINNSGQLSTIRNLDGLDWGLIDPAQVDLVVVAGNGAGESQPRVVSIFLSLSGSTRCGLIPDGQTRFINVAATPGTLIGDPVDTHAMDSIWISEIYIDVPPGFPAVIDPEIVTCFDIRSPPAGESDPTFAQIEVLRPPADFIDDAAEDQIHKIDLQIRGHVPVVDCPQFIDGIVPVYILPANTGVIGGDDDATVGTDFGQFITSQALRNCVRANLGLDGSQPITADLVLALTHLDCFCEGITDIDGLQLFKNLTFLNLNNNMVEDIRFISGLLALEDLKLSGNLLGDLETNNPLASLVNLLRLDLSHNGIVDSNAFSTLVNLEFVSLSDNQLCEIASLAANTGVGEGDTILLDDNHLTSQAALNQIGQIQSRNPLFLSFEDQTSVNCALLMPLSLLDWPDTTVADYARAINGRDVCPF